MLCVFNIIMHKEKYKSKIMRVTCKKLLHSILLVSIIMDFFFFSKKKKKLRQTLIFVKDFNYKSNLNGYTTT